MNTNTQTVNMKRYKLWFTGRKVGAIGKFQQFSVTIWANNEREATLALYETHEHISNLKIEKLTNKGLTKMNTARQQLKEALLDLSKPNYKQIRENIIAEMGYENFCKMQNSIFKEIGTIKLEQSNLNNHKYQFCEPLPISKAHQNWRNCIDKANEALAAWKARQNE